MGVEHSIGAGPVPGCGTDAHHRIRPGQRACPSHLWTSAMGSPILYGRLPWISFCSSARWEFTLPRPSPSVLARTPIRARWLPSGLVCRSHRGLSHLPVARAVSGKPFQPQTPTAQRGPLASGSLSGSASGLPARPTCSSSSSARSACLIPRPMARLAPRSHPANLFGRDPHRNPGHHQRCDLLV
jgi:hypothetical protein